MKRRNFIYRAVVSAVCCLLGAGYAMCQSLDSLEKQLLDDDKRSYAEQIKLYDDLSWGYLNVDATKSIGYGKKGLDLARRTGDNTMKATFLRNIGVAYYMANTYDTASTYLHQALEMALETGSDYLEARIHFALGNLHNQQSNYQEALEYYLKSLAVMETLDNQPLEGVFNSIAVLYQNLRNQEQALVYFDKARRAAEKNGNRWVMGAVAMAMSNYYMDEAPAQALAYANEALENFKAEGDVYNEILSLLTIGHCYRVAGNLDEAITYAQAGLVLAEQSSFPKLIAEAEADLSNIHYDRGEYVESMAHAGRSWAIDSTDIDLSANMLSNILRSNIHLQQTDSAIHWFDRYWDWTNAYSSENYQQSLSEMEVKYETEKKTLQITALEKQRTLYGWLGVVGAILLLITLAFFFLKHRLAESKRKLAEQQVKQMEQEKQLVAVQAALDGEAAERSRLAKDLHDGLGSMLSVVKFNLPEMKSGVMLEVADVNRFQKAMSMLDESIHELRRVAHHMMPESLIRYGLKVALADFCDAIPLATFHHFGSDQRFPEKLEVLVYRCVHELVNNALKHAEATQINVQLVQDADRLSFTVQDNGKGFDPDKVDGGMGLDNIRKRVESYRGNLHIYASQGKGAEIHIEFDLNTVS